jgi:hypothetical protein
MKGKSLGKIEKNNGIYEYMMVGREGCCFGQVVHVMAVMFMQSTHMEAYL